MLQTVFLVTVTCQVFASSLVVTIAMPRLDAWPPPSRPSGEFRFAWGCTAASVLSTFLVGVFDWNSFNPPAWLRVGLGVSFIPSGVALARWGIRTVSVHATLGLGGNLDPRWALRLHPESPAMGDLACPLGWFLPCGSRAVLIPCIAWSFWFVLTPARGGAMAASAVWRFVPRFLRLLGRSRGGLPPLAGQKDRELPTLRRPRARPSGRSRGATRRGYPTPCSECWPRDMLDHPPRYMSRPGVSALALPQRCSDGQRRGSTGAKGSTHVECLAVVFPILWCST